MMTSSPVFPLNKGDFIAFLLEVALYDFIFLMRLSKIKHKG